jgi:FAD/FMN-containing dehydrogenase
MISPGGIKVTIKSDLGSIIGNDKIDDRPEATTRYSVDLSLVAPGRPDAVVYVTSTPEIQEVVRYAAVRQIPVTPRSSSIGFYGAGIPTKGGIIIDMTRMNRILEVDPLDRKIKVEPGVTYGQAQAALVEKGMMVACPLLPHSGKSLLTSSMQREPLLIPKAEYNENFLTGELVLADGRLFWLGTAMSKGMVGKSNPEAFILGTKIFRGSQGTLGLATWANIKAEPLPLMDKIFFIPSENMGDVVKAAYHLEYLMIGNECFIINRRNLALIYAQLGIGSIQALEAVLPPFCLVFVISGLKRRPEGRIALEEEAMIRTGKEFGFNPVQSIGGIKDTGSQLLDLLRKPWPGQVYWKQYPKPGFAEVFFNATMDKHVVFLEEVRAVARRNDYPVDEIGFYLQPIERGRMGFHCYTFNYDPADVYETAKVRSLYLETSTRVFEAGGLFTNPYGLWAQIVYQKVTGFDTVIRSVKKAFDPHNILNPGKLLNN